MHELYFILFILLGIYAFILFIFGAGFLLTKNVMNFLETENPVSIIVCARNEEKNVKACLYSILQQDYDKSKIEIIFSNDASSDSTKQIAEEILSNSKISFLLLSSMEQIGKKKTLQNAISTTNNAFIITRDADTVSPSKNWLKQISNFQTQSQSDFIIAPVAIADNHGLLWALQAFENNILMTISCGSTFFKMPFLCSGANLSFSKSVFEKTNGYDSHINIPSGDDVLFLEEAKRINGAKINFLKSREAIVYTNPERTFKNVIQQKIRWASKFKVNRNIFNFLFALLIFLTNAGWVFALLHGYFRPIHNPESMNFVLLKVCIDFVLLLISTQLIKNKNLLWYYLPIACIYPLYASIVAVCSLFLTPDWKK